MKNLKLLALALVIGTTSIFANTANLPDEITKKIRTQIVELLDEPEFTVSNDIAVMITFTFNSEGQIVVLNVDSGNRDVLDYVRENLNGKKIENPGKRDIHYTMPLKMKVS